MVATRKMMILAAIIFCGASFGVMAGNRGTADEAKALLQKAAEHYKQVGRKQALQDFNEKTDVWVKGDLYVACVDSKHTLVANGGYPKYVGMPEDMGRDESGKPLGQRFWDAAAKGETAKWKWFNPVTKVQEPKVGFVQKFDEDLVCLVGYYPGP